MTAQDNSMKHSISFGTSCMNRLPHLEHIYIDNIETALSVSSDIKFVLLNYNSQDGMHKWVRSELKKYIDKGIVKYLHTTKPTTFSQAITKNILTKHGLCDVVSLLDADNKLTSLYVETLLHCYNQPDTYYADKRDWFSSKHDHRDAQNRLIASSKHLLVHARERQHVSGRITCYKKDLLQIGGYDESMTGWGYEEEDFMNRHQRYFNQPKKLLVADQYKQPKGFINLLLSTNHLNIPTTSRPELQSRHENKMISQENIKNNILIANASKEWGEL